MLRGRRLDWRPEVMGHGLSRWALVTVREDGEFFVARVEVESPLPGLTLSAEAVAAAEPSVPE
jgi:hypothetical protein